MFINTNGNFSPAKMKFVQQKLVLRIHHDMDVNLEIPVKAYRSHFMTWIYLSHEAMFVNLDHGRLDNGISYNETHDVT